MQTKPFDKNLSCKSASGIPFVLFLTLFAILPSPLAMAASLTWTGGGGSNNWNLAGNWGGTTPVGNDDLTFAGTTRTTNTNDFTADTTFTGIAFASGAGAFTLNGNAIILNGGITNNSTNNQTINLAMTLNTTQTFTNIAGKGDIVVNGIISGNGGLTHSGAGTLTLGAANTFTGTTWLQNGVINLANVNALQNSTLRDEGGYTLTFGVAGTNTYNIGNLKGTSTSTFINMGGNTLSIGGNNGSYSYLGYFTGTGGSLTKVGSGTLMLSGTSSYTGATTIQAGTLEVGANAPSGSSGALGNATSAIVLGNGSTLAGDVPALIINGAYNVGRAITVGSVTNSAAYNAIIGGSNTTGTSTYTGNITLNLTANSYTATLQAATGGTVEFKTGTWVTNDKAITVGSSGNTGTVKLSNSLVTTGGINVNYGTLQLGAANALGGSTTPVTIGGGTLDVSGYTDTIKSLNITSGALTLGINNNTPVLLTVSNAFTLGGTINVAATGSQTLGLYKLAGYASKSNSFTQGTVPTGYKLVANTTELDLQHLADQSFSYTTPSGTPRALVSTNVSLSGTLTNTAPSGSSTLAAALTSTGTLTVGSLTSSTGATVTVGTPSTITGSIATGTTAGTLGWQVTNTDANAVTTAPTISGSINVVNQRSFNVGTPTINLGRYLITGSTPSGTTAISSTGLNAVTANATLGNFSTVSGLTLTTSDSKIFNGGSGSQTANYTVGGTASSAGAISGTFSSAVTAELGSMSNVSVAVTGNALNQRSFSVGTPTIALGRFLVGVTQSGSTAISSSGLNAATANATLGSFSGTGTGSLTLTTSDATAFNGGSSSQTANYSLGGSVAATGALSGSFSSAVTAELGSISNVVVNVTGTGVNQRSFSVGTPTIALGRYLITGSTPSGTTAISSTGLNAVTANATLGSFSTVSGLTLTTGNSTAFNGGSSPQTANYTVGGTASSAGAISGTFSSAVTAELGSISNVNVAVTGNALNQRSFTSPSTIALGRVLLGNSTWTGKSGSVTSTSNDHASVADSTLAAYSGSAINGLTLSGGSYAFVGGASNPTGTYTLSGTLTGTAGSAVGGTFNLGATDEFTNTNTSAASVTYSGTGVASRTVTAPTSTSLGTFHAGAAVSVTSNAAGYSYGTGGSGAHSNTEDATLSYSGSAENGINLTSINQTINTATGATGTFSGTAPSAGSYSGSFSVGASRELSGAQSNVGYGYTMNTYSGAMVWSGTGGTYATGSNWTDSVSGGAQVAPGLDAGFTGVDTATFNGSGGTVTLGSSAPSLNAITFSGGSSYTLSGGSITLAGRPRRSPPLARRQSALPLAAVLA